MSRGLGLSLQITGNDVRVKGFSSALEGDVGPAQACGAIEVGGCAEGGKRYIQNIRL